MTKAPKGMRKGLFILIAVALIYSAVSWYVGKQAEARITEQVQQFSHRLQQSLGEEATGQVKVVSYQRGVWSSTVHYELLIADEEQQSHLRFEDRLSHGPWPWAAVRQGHWAPRLAYSQAQLLLSPSVQPWFEATQGEVPLQAYSHIAFDGLVQSRVELAAVKAQLPIEGGGVLPFGFDAAQLLLHSSKKAEQPTVHLQSTMPNLWVDSYTLGQLEMDVELHQLFAAQPTVHLHHLRLANAGGSSAIQSEVKVAASAMEPLEQIEVDLAHFFDTFVLDAQLSRPMVKAVFEADSFEAGLADLLFVQWAKQAEKAGWLRYDGAEAAFSLRFEAATNTLLLNGEPTDINQLLYAWLALQMGGL